MNTETTETANSTVPTAEPPLVVAAPKRRATKKRLATFTATDKDSSTLHHCAKAIVEILRRDGPLTRAQLEEKIAQANLKTTQSAVRVLYYWKRALETDGFIIVSGPGGSVEPAAAPSEPTEPAPAPAI